MVALNAKLEGLHESFAHRNSNGDRISLVEFTDIGKEYSLWVQPGEYQPGLFQPNSIRNKLEEEEEKQEKEQEEKKEGEPELSDATQGSVAVEVDWEQVKLSGDPSLLMKLERPALTHSSIRKQAVQQQVLGNWFLCTYSHCR